jgi:hypothetical protein
MSDRMTNVLMTFIHQHARSLEDEIARAEAAIRALPEIDVSTQGDPADPEVRGMLRQLQQRVEELRLLASLRDPGRHPRSGGAATVGATRRNGPPRGVRAQPY